jgi:hypothetical protein
MSQSGGVYQATCVGSSTDDKKSEKSEQTDAEQKRLAELLKKSLHLGRPVIRRQEQLTEKERREYFDVTNTKRADVSKYSPLGADTVQRVECAPSHLPNPEECVKFKPPAWDAYKNQIHCVFLYACPAGHIYEGRMFERDGRLALMPCGSFPTLEEAQVHAKKVVGDNPYVTAVIANAAEWLVIPQPRESIQRASMTDQLAEVFNTKSEEVKQNIDKLIKRKQDVANQKATFDAVEIDDNKQEVKRDKQQQQEQEQHQHKKTEDAVRDEQWQPVSNRRNKSTKAERKANRANRASKQDA